MSVRVADGVIRIEGIGQVADAEPILTALLDDASRAVDLSGASRLHSAIVQLLMAFRPRVMGAPSDPFYAAHIVTLLDTNEGSE
jgi:hypothetical protein